MVRSDKSGLASRPADPPARVVVVDPRPADRGSLVAAMRERPELEVISEAGDGSSASARIAELAPDVAVIDLHVLGFDGLRVLERVIEHQSRTRVVFLSGGHDAEIAYQA